jgi:hypothetical protein
VDDFTKCPHNNVIKEEDYVICADCGTFSKSSFSKDDTIKGEKFNDSYTLEIQTYYERQIRPRYILNIEDRALLSEIQGKSQEDFNEYDEIEQLLQGIKNNQDSHDKIFDFINTLKWLSASNLLEDHRESTEEIFLQIFKDVYCLDDPIDGYEFLEDIKKTKIYQLKDYPLIDDFFLEKLKKINDINELWFLIDEFGEPDLEKKNQLVEKHRFLIEKKFLNLQNQLYNSYSTERFNNFVVAIIVMKNFIPSSKKFFSFIKEILLSLRSNFPKFLEFLTSWRSGIDNDSEYGIQEIKDIINLVKGTELFIENEEQIKKIFERMKRKS